MSAGRRRLRSWVLLGLPLAWLGVIVSARAGASAPGRWLEPVGALLASLVQLAVAWTGIDTLRQGALLYAPGAFAYEIGIGCTGLLPAAVVATAIVASPGTAGRKAWGLAIAVPLVLLVNLLRLAHLFYLGVRAPALYENAHRFWWEAALVGVVLAVWLVWSRVGEAAVTHSLRPGR